MIEQIVDKLKQAVPEIIFTGTPAVSSPGVYLLLEDISPLSRNKDTVVFQLIIAAENFLNGPGAAVPTIKSIRERVLRLENEFTGVELVKGVKSVVMEGIAYAYTMELEIEIYNEVIYDEILSEA